MDNFQRLQTAELMRARKLHGGIHSAHEGYAIILEELDEFWEQVKLKKSKRNPEGMLEELVQIAAMAQKTAEDILLSSDLHKEQS